MTAPDPTPTIVDQARSMFFTGDIPAPGVTATTPIDDLCADLAERWALSCKVEEHFLVEFADDEIEGWATLADIAASVIRQQQGAAA